MQIAGNIKQNCSCGFNEMYISNQLFQCDPQEDGQVTFRAQLFGTCSVRNTTICNFLNSWVRSAPKVLLQTVEHNIDPNCDPCQLSICQNTVVSLLAIGVASGVSVGVFLFVAMLIVFVVVILLVRRTKIKYRAHDDGYVNINFCNYYTQLIAIAKKEHLSRECCLHHTQ